MARLPTHRRAAPRRTMACSPQRLGRSPDGTGPVRLSHGPAGPGDDPVAATDDDYRAADRADWHAHVGCRQPSCGLGTVRREIAVSTSLATLVAAARFGHA